MSTSGNVLLIQRQVQQLSFESSQAVVAWLIWRVRLILTNFVVSEKPVSGPSPVTLYS